MNREELEKNIHEGDDNEMTIPISETVASLPHHVEKRLQNCRSSFIASGVS